MSELIPESEYEDFVTGQRDLLSAAERAEYDAIEADDLCPDCDVVPGEEHSVGCDVARCLWSGRQRLMCGGDGAGWLTGRPDPHDCGRDIWTGKWPGEMECEEYGWFTSLPGYQHMPDLNRLVIECRWDREQRRWVR